MQDTRNRGQAFLRSCGKSIRAKAPFFFFVFFFSYGLGACMRQFDKNKTVPRTQTTSDDFAHQKPLRRILISINKVLHRKENSAVAQQVRAHQTERKQGIGEKILTGVIVAIGVPFAAAGYIVGGGLFVTIISNTVYWVTGSATPDLVLAGSFLLGAAVGAYMLAREFMQRPKTSDKKTV